MTLHSLPLFVRLNGRPVILLGEGEPAAAKRRLLERAGAVLVGEDAQAALAVVALDEPEAAVARLRARGVLVNAVDRPDLCDFTLPAIVDRDPVILAIGTGGVSAGLAAALRQRLEALIPGTLGSLAQSLYAIRPQLRQRFPDMGERRRALGAAMAAGGPLDPLGATMGAQDWLGSAGKPVSGRVRIVLRSDDPDELTLREARALANADCVLHGADVPVAVLDRARADAMRLPLGSEAAEGLTVEVVTA
ncbi:NAD(P)-dependent oxidoreductase [uncultured Sphingomonas sp.]|uniref:precorrin-2 dehydrogenase/sirohydrochlorin ferrochelatase family protein n=1 Tax=uncultured Sphingomonas sp. TaxID=158754 RepID=UPI0035CA8DD1